MQTFSCILMLEMNVDEKLLITVKYMYVTCIWELSLLKDFDNNIFFYGGCLGSLVFGVLVIKFLFSVDVWSLL